MGFLRPPGLELPFAEVPLGGVFRRQVGPLINNIISYHFTVGNLFCGALLTLKNSL